MTTYDKWPEIPVAGYDNCAWEGWEGLAATLNETHRGRQRTVLALDCYPGVRLRELEEKLFPLLGPALTLNAEEARRDEAALHTLLARNLTDDRVFGVLSCHQLNEFIDPDALERLNAQVEACREGLIVIYGPGAALVHPGDVWFMPIFRAGRSSNACAAESWITGEPKTRVRICFAATSVPFSLNGGCSTDIKPRCSNGPILSLIPPTPGVRPWFQAMRCVRA